MTPVPTITFMSATDPFCGTAAQPKYWANFRSASGAIRTPGSLLEVVFLDGWGHGEITSFFGVTALQGNPEKVETVHAMWAHFLLFRR